MGVAMETMVIVVCFTDRGVKIQPHISREGKKTRKYDYI
jgi:hypothetical protein